MKKIFSFFVFACLILQVFAMGSSEVAENGTPVVATSFNAIKEIVSVVAGDKITVVSIIPDNAEAHHYEPSPKDLAKLHSADLLFINGLEMEEWVEGLVENKLYPEEKLVVLSEGLDLIKLAEGETACACCCGHDHHHDHDHDHDHDHEHDHHHDHDHHHHHGDFDPHVWLGLTESADMAENVAKALSKFDAKNAGYYKANAKKFSKDIIALRDEYREKIVAKKQRTIVVGHEAFGYLCRDLNLEQIGVRDTFNTGEASAKQLAELVNFCKKNKIKVVFSEEFASPQVSKTLARDAGATVDVLYTLEQAADGLSLYDRQKANLDKIYNSLN